MTRSSNPRVVLLFGPPGAGKGTQAELLAERFGWSHVESSKFLEHWITTTPSEARVEIEGNFYTAQDQQKKWETGILMDPPLVAYLLKGEVRRLRETGQSIVTSGAFRTLYEAQSALPLAFELYGKENIRVVSLNLSEDGSVFRNSHRRICSLLRHPVLYGEETKNLTACPLDGSLLLKRKGLDDPETIRVRLREYNERTKPVFQYLESQGLPAVDVNADQTPSRVFEDIQKAIG
ncbi:MAG: nucleoside monophosphate kinase [Candidatus Wildermuthbacteria bacterium]|nr:nucleoside monophosphate kinase [Candidatus Wildermuthbacteria bacterium]